MAKFGSVLQKGLGAVLAGFLFVWLGSNNLFGLVQLGDVGQAIVVATGVLTLSAGVSSYVPKLPKPLNKGVITGLLTIVIGTTGLFGLFATMGFAPSAIATGIVVGFGVVTLLSGIMMEFGLGRLGR